MNKNSSNSSAWALCPSKKFSGKFYYFNVVTGQTVWSVSDSDVKSLNKNQKNKNVNYPEPSNHPDEPIPPNNPYNFDKSNPSTSSNYISPPIITSTQEFLSNSNTNKYVPDVDSTISNYGMNPYDFSTPSNNHSDFCTPSNNHTDFAPRSNLNANAIHSNSIFSTPNKRNYATHSNVDIAPSYLNDLNNVPKDVTPSSVSPMIRIPPLNLITSTKETDNVTKYLWVPVPFEYFNDSNGKTQPLKQSVPNNPLSTFNETEISETIHRNNNENLNGTIFVSNPQSLKRSVKNHPLTTFNETEIANKIQINNENLKGTFVSTQTLKRSIQDHPLTKFNERETVQPILNLNNQEIRPKIDNLELIKKFRDKFNGNDMKNDNSTIQNSDSTIQLNVNPISESIGPKIVRKINRIPEFESKISSISSKEVVMQKKTLCQGDKVENKEDISDNLSENDLRTILVKRKLESKKNNEVPEKKSRSDLIEKPVTPKKKVTFKLDLTDDESSEQYQEFDDEEPELPKNAILSKLRQLGAIENIDWYIVVDLNVVQESLDFLHTFVRDDPFCKILIPYSVYNWLSTLSMGESRGARLVQFARQTLRKIDFAARSNQVIIEKITDTKEKILPQTEQILNCCFKLSFNDIHVVLITGSNILYKEAEENGIHVFKIEEILKFDDNEPGLTFDIQKFQSSVPFDSSNEKTVNDSTVECEITSSVPNLNNDRTNVPISNTERVLNSNSEWVLNSNSEWVLNSNSERVLNSNSEMVRKNLFVNENSQKLIENTKETNFSNSSDISECTMISTDIHKSNNNTEKPQKVLSKYFTQENKGSKIPNFKNFIIQSKNNGNGKETHLKIIGENVTQVKDTEMKNTQPKNTGMKDTQAKTFGKNKLLRQLLLKDTESNNTKFKVIENDANLKIIRENTTKSKDTEVTSTYFKNTKENHTQSKNTKEKHGSIFEIENDFMPVTCKTIEDELKRFYVKNKVAMENLEKRKDEYFCIFRQIFEEMFDVIKNISILKFDGKKIWSIFDLLQLLRKNGVKKVQLISEKMIDLLHEYDNQGTVKLKKDLNSNELMPIIGCGVILVQCLKESYCCQELKEIENDFYKLLDSIENPQENFFDAFIPDIPIINRNYESQERKNYLKPRKYIIDYLKKHYIHWKEYEQDEEMSVDLTHQSSTVNIVRTSGRNLSLIKLNRTKSIMDGRTEIDEPKMKTNTPKNDEKQTKNDEKYQNEVTSTEPIMIRSINGIVQENKVNYNLNETKHQNTFDTTTNGPKVICKIAPIKEFEEKIICDLDKLDFSEMSNTESNTSGLSIITDSNIEENIDQNTEQTKDKENLILKDNDTYLNGEIFHANGLTSTLKTSLINERTRSNSINESNDRTTSFNENNGKINPLNENNERINFLNENNGRTNSINEKNERIRSLNDHEINNSLNDPINNYSFNNENNRINSLNDENERVNSLYNINNNINSFNDNIQRVYSSDADNKLHNPSNNEKNRINSFYNEMANGHNEKINSLNGNDKINSFNDDNETINLETESNGHVFKNKSMNESKTANSKSKRLFLKSFLKEINGNLKFVVDFCEKCLKVLLKNNLKKEEIVFIKDNAIKVQSVLNKFITNLIRIIIREKNEGTFVSLFSKDNINYANIIQKCLDQANTLELTLEQIIMQSL